MWSLSHNFGKLILGCFLTKYSFPNELFLKIYFKRYFSEKKTPIVAHTDYDLTKLKSTLPDDASTQDKGFLVI